MVAACIEVVEKKGRGQVNPGQMQGQGYDTLVICPFTVCPFFHACCLLSFLPLRVSCVRVCPEETKLLYREEWLMGQRISANRQKRSVFFGLLAKGAV